jgi:hypothetical protein
MPLSLRRHALLLGLLAFLIAPALATRVAGEERLPPRRSRARLISTKGRRLEGAGITPDKIVTATIAGLQQQRDVALEEAESHLDSLRAAPH